MPSIATTVLPPPSAPTAALTTIAVPIDNIDAIVLPAAPHLPKPRRSRKFVSATGGIKKPCHVAFIPSSTRRFSGYLGKEKRNLSALGAAAMTYVGHFPAKTSLPLPSRDRAALKLEPLLPAHKTKVSTFEDYVFSNTAVSITTTAAIRFATELPPPPSQPSDSQALSQLQHPLHFRGHPRLLHVRRNASTTPQGLGKLQGLRKEAAKISIIKGVSGIIKPFRLTVLLGPPGCGKTTLLLVLAGKFNISLKVSGEISYNGCKLEEFIPQKTSTYISQYDLHNFEMTVGEILNFSARCQGVGSRSEVMMEEGRRKKEVGIILDPEVVTYMKAISVQGLEMNLQTDYILKILRLDICNDIPVGDVMRRGISGGQKKRLTTGEMLVGPNKALFMDEISTGFDNSTTFQIVSCLQQLVQITDATTLVSLLQHAPKTYDLFDDIILMAEGKIVYHGPHTNVLKFFEDCGFRCPEREGAVDFLQEVINRKDQVQYWYRTDVPYDYVSVIISRDLKTETTQVVRQASPSSESEMLVVDSVVPGGPAHNHMEPGDVLVRVNDEIITQFLKLEVLLDDNVGQLIDMQIERGGVPFIVQLMVHNLHVITPNHFLKVSGAVIHPLSYQQVRNFRFNCGLVYVIETGYMLSRAGAPRCAITKKFAGEEILVLDDFISVFKKLSRSARVPLEYISYTDRHRSKSVLMTIDCHAWYALPHIYTREDSTDLGIAHPAEAYLLPSSLHQDGRHHIQVLHELIGVAGQIIPWNFPLLMFAWKSDLPLAYGNSMVLKSADQISLSALYAVRLFQKARLPDGVLNVVSGFAPTAGAALASHMDVDNLAFTGSTDTTVELARFVVFFNKGQCCCAGFRPFVHLACVQ